MPAFSSADPRRRRCTDVMTSTRSIFRVIDTVILLVLNQGVGPVRCFRGSLQLGSTPVGAESERLNNRGGHTVADGLRYRIAAGSCALLALTWPASAAEGQPK